MNLSRLFWRLLFALGALFTVPLALVGWVLVEALPAAGPVEHAAPSPEFASPVRIVAVAVAGGLLAAALLALGLARVWSQRLGRLTAVIRRLSRGDLSARADLRGAAELAPLAAAVNELGEALASQLNTVDRQRRTLESLVAQLHEGVVLVDPDNRIILINDAAVRLLSLTPPDGRSAVSFAGLAVERCIPQHSLQALLLQPSAARPVPGADDNRPPAALRPAGLIGEARIQVGSSAGPLVVRARAWAVQLPGRGSEPSQSANGRLLALTDITELARTVQAKVDFVANASHELRTPLSAIRAAVETLAALDPATEPDAVRRFIDVTDRQTQRLEALVDDLLELARVESAATPFEPRPLRPRDVMAELRARFAQAVAEKSINWTDDLPDDGQRRVTAHPHLLHLVLSNLIDNAIKFTDAGGSVRVSWEFQPHHVCIRVADTGCGIPEQDQERVFERFYQVERARSGNVRGTGLGLAIVRHAVTAMRGRVSLTSSPQGTTVTVDLPQ